MARSDRNAHATGGGDGTELVLAETQTAGFGLANGNVVHALVVTIDEQTPEMTVREVRREYPRPPGEHGDPHTKTVEQVVVTPDADFGRRKVEIGTRHGQDRVIAETHDHAPRAFVRHEHNDGNWGVQASWELHPATGVTQTAGETATDGGEVRGCSQQSSVYGGGRDGG